MMKGKNKHRRIGLILGLGSVVLLVAGFLLLADRNQKPPPTIARDSKLQETLFEQASMVGMELRVKNERILEEIQKSLNKNERGITELQGKQYEYLLLLKNLEEPSVSIKESQISLRIFLDIALFAVPLKDQGLPQAEMQKKANIRLTGKGRFSFDWKVSLNSDWTVDQNLEWSNEWEKSPWLYYKGLYLPVASVIRSKLNEVINRANQTMADQLSTLLQEQAVEFWQQLQEPRLLHDLPKAWVRFIPAEIHIPAFFGDANDLVWRFGILGKLSIWVEETPPQVDYLPLSDLNTRPIPKSRFEIKLPILSNMKSVAQSMEVAITNFLEQEEWQQLHASVSEIKIYPTVNVEGQRELVIQQKISVRLWGVLPFAGTFYFLAQPDWNQQTSTLVISKLRWQSQSQTMAERLIFTGLGEALAVVLEKEWQISLAEKKEETLIRLNKQISFVDTKNKIQWKNRLDELDVSSLLFDSKYILILVTLSGSAKALLY